MLLSIDHGNKQIKFNHGVFTSGILQHDTCPIGEGVLYYEGKYYTLTNQRIPYQWDKTLTDDFFIMTLFAAAQKIEADGIYIPDNVIDITLLTGLPFSHFGTLTEKFEKYFTRPADGSYLEFQYESRPFYICFEEVNVYAQGFAAAMTNIAKLKDYSKVYIIDIGGITTDYLQLVHGKTDRSQSGSLEYGIIDLYNMIQRIVQSERGMIVDDEQIDSMLKGEDILNDSAMITQVQKAAQSFVSTLIAQLRERKIDLRTAPVVFVGGGSITLKKHIEQSSEVLTNCSIVDNLYANTDGYVRLYNAQKALKKA